MKTLIYILCLGAISGAHAAELIKTCDIGGNPKQQVAVLRDSKIASTHVYYLQQQGTRTPIFGTAEQSRGDTVSVQCVGRSQRALVVSGEFTANALQGFVITRPAGTTTAARLDFAEKERPKWLYIGPTEMMVVFPTQGYGESEAKYVMYRHAVDKAVDDQAVPIDELPSQGKLERVWLRTVSR